MITIIEETDDYVMAWKEANLPTAPTDSRHDCLITRLVHEHPDLAEVRGYKAEEFGLLNRLDNRTVGMVMIAKTQHAFERLSGQFRQEQWTKLYLAYCYDLGNQDKGVIDLPVAHHLYKAKKMVLVRDNEKYRGQPQNCSTLFEKISVQYAKDIWERCLYGKIVFPVLPQGFTWIMCRIKRGKRHQIRLHLKSAGYPILGDDLYKPPTEYRTEWAEHYALYAVKYEKNC